MKIISVIEYLNKIDRASCWGRACSLWESHNVYIHYYRDAMRIYRGIQS